MLDFRTTLRHVPLLLLLLLAWPSVGNASERPDKTLSPYFYIPGGDPKTEQLPLAETKAKVEIAGVIAKVAVTQVYVNRGTKPIEAVYVFPGSTRAAVVGMEMQIGDRVIVAKIQTRADASKIYEKARKAGKTASLLQQERPNVFSMRVANIMPKDRVVVRLRYVETLVPSQGVYEFVYPTVVGPRYSEKTSGSGQGWIENPHTKAGAAPSYTWDIEAKITSGTAIRGLKSPSHTLATAFSGPKVASVDVNEAAGGNRDFVLRYRLVGDAIETGMLLFPGAKEKFFLAMVQPPRTIAPKQLPAREYVFIVDVSGSMNGFPMATTKKLMTRILGGLKPTDRLNLMTFAGDRMVLAKQSLRANKRNIAKALRAVNEMRGGGSTQLLPALQQALAMKRDATLATTFVVITDGYVAIEKEAFELVRKSRGKANLFAFGVGSSVNRHLVEGLARAGMGESFIALDAGEADKQAVAFARYIASPVLTNVKLRFAGFDAYDIVPKSIPDVFSERPVLVFGKYRGKAQGRLELSGLGGTGTISVTMDLASTAQESKDNEALRYLWARHQIQELEDELEVLHVESKAKAKITALGLRYGLMTQYTSFVAVDSLVRNTSGKSSTVRQALPMPAGVSGNAVGSIAGGWGYGIAGKSSGGGGTGWGTIGHGSVGTIGHGTGSGSGYGRGKRPQPPTLRIAQATVSGSLDKAIIRRYMRRKLPRLRHCYEKELVKDPMLAGTIVVRFTIGADGLVSAVHTSGVANERLSKCMARAVRSIKFPKPAGGGNVSVKYPLALRPAQGSHR